MIDGPLWPLVVIVGGISGTMRREHTHISQGMLSCDDFEVNGMPGDTLLVDSPRDRRTMSPRLARESPFNIT